jgi:hypothetical protein
MAYSKGQNWKTLCTLAEPQSSLEDREGNGENEKESAGSAKTLQPKPVLEYSGMGG